MVTATRGPWRDWAAAAALAAASAAMSAEEVASAAASEAPRTGDSTCAAAAAGAPKHKEVPVDTTNAPIKTTNVCFTSKACPHVRMNE